MTKKHGDVKKKQGTPKSVAFHSPSCWSRQYFAAPGWMDGVPKHDLVLLQDVFLNWDDRFVTRRRMWGDERWIRALLFNQWPWRRLTMYLHSNVPTCIHNMDPTATPTYPDVPRYNHMYPQCRSPIYPQLPTCTPKFSFSINDHGGVRPLSTQHKRPPHWDQTATPPTTSFLLSGFPPHVGKTAGQGRQCTKFEKSKRPTFEYIELGLILSSAHFLNTQAFLSLIGKGILGQSTRENGIYKGFCTFNILKDDTGGNINGREDFYNHRISRLTYLYVHTYYIHVYVL